MELGIAGKHRYFACSVNQSLLELAVKLRKAEVRVNGRTLQKADPPHDVVPGVSSTVNGGRFHFIARNNYVPEKFPATKFSNSIPVDSRDCAVEMTTVDAFHASSETSRVQNVQQLYTSDMTVDAIIATLLQPKRPTPRKLSLPDRTGPSLWPFLSSVKASVDAEHVKFLDKNRKFYLNYDRPSIAEGYIEPLSAADFEIIIDSAVDSLLQTRESRMLHQMVTSATEPYVSASVSTPSTPVNDDINIPVIFEADDISSSAGQPMVVSKRYAAAVANPRRFKCGLCPYSTNNRSHVRRHHLSVHSDARPYRCYVCGKEFARCENAKVHMVSRHPDVPYDIDRLRSSVFFKSHNNASSKLPPAHDDSAPSTTAYSSDDPVSRSRSALLWQQHAASSSTPAQWKNPIMEAELKRAGLDHLQAISPWLHLPPKSEPKPNQSIPVFGRGSMDNQSAEGIPRNLYQALTNTSNFPLSSFLGSVGRVKQEPMTIADTKASGYSFSDRQMCMYCHCMFHNTAELANHIATSHSSLNPASHAVPNSNPGYVVLQTAAPIFLFPYGSDPTLTNKGQAGIGYQPILPKVPVTSNESKSPNETSVGHCLSAGTLHGSLPYVASTTTASVANSLPRISSVVSLKTSDFQAAHPTESSDSVDKPRSQRKRQFRTFYCSRCPDRAPFRYEKSFEKHLIQHRNEQAQKLKELASKVSKP